MSSARHGEHRPRAAGHLIGALSALQDLDLRQGAAELKIPVYLVEGRFEPRGRKDLAKDWFQRLQAPQKRWVKFETSGHRPLFEQPAEFAELRRTIIAER